MFDFVRSHTRLLQGLLVLLIFPSFVFFGVQGYSSFTDQAASAVATVAGKDITQTELDAAHRQQIDRMRQQMPQVDVKLFDTPEMKQQTLDALVRERVLQTAVVKEHLGVTEARLHRLFLADEQYSMLRKPDGSINKDFLTAQGMSVRQFEDSLRQEYAMRQVLGGVSGSAVSGQVVLDAALAALLERREVQLQRFDARSYIDKMAPTDAEVETFYKSRTAQFRSPEEASIEYVLLDLDALKKQVTVSDADLQQYYNENISRYTAAEERRASHILIAANKDAPAEDRKAAKARAESLLAEVRKQPEAFADLARKNSGDPGSADKGGDLDFFARGAMVKPFEDAAYAMKAGEVSNVVESDFGYHIIKLTAVRGGERKPFESVRSELLEEVGKQQAQKRYAEAAEQFTNMVYEQSDSLQPVVDKLKLTKLTATVRRAAAPGAKGPLTSLKLLEAVFNSDSIQSKRNTEAVETGPNQLVSARVVEHRPERVLPLSEVRAQVLEQLRTEQAAVAARKDGEARVVTLKAAPAESLGQSLVVSRTQPQGLPRQVLEAALRADLTQAPAIVGVDLGAQGYVALKVLKREAAAADDADGARARPYVRQALAEAEAAAYLESLKRRYKVEIKHSAKAAAAAASEAAEKL